LAQPDAVSAKPSAMLPLADRFNMPAARCMALVPPAEGP
jgi:hypothetical protein